MKEVREIEGKYYFAYGSNMNLGQMAFRCPAAEVVENVRVEGYRLAFCGRPSGSGVATILPEEGSHVDGVLWKITKECERSLDCYEGYPHLYGKETICVKNADGKERDVTVYTIKEPYKSQPSVPSSVYLEGILEGCRENGISEKAVLEVQRIPEGKRGRRKKEKPARQTGRGKSTRWRKKQESRSSRQKCLKGSGILQNLRTLILDFPLKVFENGMISKLKVHVWGGIS